MVKDAAEEAAASGEDAGEGAAEKKVQAAEETAASGASGKDAAEEAAEDGEGAVEEAAASGVEAPEEPAASDSEPRANSKPAAGEPEPLAKSRRRELTAKRNELRAMLSQVDRTMGPQHGTAARDRTMGPPSSAGHFSFSHAMPPTSARWHARCDARVMHDVTPLAMHGAEHNVCGTRCDARCKRACIDALHRRRKRSGSPISGQFGQAALGTQPAGAADGQAGAQAAHHAGRRSRLSGAG